MSELFDVRRERPGIRLNRLEIFNWGTFDSGDGAVYVAHPQGRTSLLVGRNGSGKSTLVDALLTLLVPNAIRNYNVAAGAGKTERSERTYVFGACDQQLGEDETQVHKRYLRKGNAFYSALLAHFYDEHANSGFTIAQILYPRADGSIDKVFLFAEGGKTIAGDLSGLAKSDGIVTAVQARGFRVTKTFNEYHNWFVRRTRVKPLAIDMFNQTVAVKDIRSLNAFIRKHMLESSGGRERVQKLIEHFAELRAAHRQLLAIRNQQQMLLPVEKFGKQFRQYSEELQHAERLRDASDAFFRLATIRLATPELQRLQDELGALETRRDDLKRQIGTAVEEARKLKNEIDLAGGDRLREIPTLIQLQQTLLQQKEGCRRELISSLAECGRVETIDDREQFSAVGQTLRQRRGEIGAIAKHQQQERDALVIERGALLQRRRELSEELDALNKRRTNLPVSLARVRTMICEDLSLDESELSFAAELLAVPVEHCEWTPSIEMVLRGFALSLLVPDRLYRRVGGYIEQTRLADDRQRGQRLVYLRVAGGGDSPARHDRLHDASLIRKLQFREGHPLLPWVRQQVESRYDYRCCETVEQFREAPRLAMTRNRHTKIGDTRHEKDDRERTVDPSRFVLGWDNRQKKKHLAERLQGLDVDVAALSRRITSKEGELAALAKESNAIDRCLHVKTFEEINDQTHRVEIAHLREEAAALKSNNDQVRILEQRLAGVEAQAGELGDERDRVGEQIGTINGQIKEGSRFIETARKKLETMKADGRLEQSQSAFNDIETGLGEPSLSFDDLFAREDRFQEERTASIARLRRVIEPIEARLTKAMGDFLRKCREEADDLDVSIASLPSFLAKLENIRRDDLPRHEARFKERLNDTVTKEIGVFHSELQTEGRQIVRKLDELNDALHELPYNDGTYMRLETRPVKNAEITEFRSSLRSCLDDTFDDTSESREARFLRIEALIRRLSEESTWRERVIDVRRWYDFGASEIDRETGQSRSYYEDSSGQSGGEKARLAFTILVAAIAYQYDLDLSGHSSGGFYFVVVDEMFSKIDDRYADYALKLFEKFGLQLMIVAPLDAKARMAEPFVQYYLQTLKDENSSRSQLVSMTAREYEEVLEKVAREEWHTDESPSRRSANSRTK